MTINIIVFFDYEPLSEAEAVRGTVGIPRVLNFYENYPYWAVFFKKLGFRTVLSPDSTRKIYELGIESIPSESECYPAKLAHGHVKWLIDQKVDFIFYPCIPYERQEIKDANNHYNCPIVTSYAENIKNNVDEITGGSVRFLNPFMSFGSKEAFNKTSGRRISGRVPDPGSGNPCCRRCSMGRACKCPWRYAEKKVKKPCNI